MEDVKYTDGGKIDRKGVKTSCLSEFLLKERGEKLHRLVNTWVFNRLLYIPYGIVAKVCVAPLSAELQETTLLNTSHEDRLRIYNNLLRFCQYFHAAATAFMVLLVAESASREDIEKVVEGTLGAVVNLFLALNLAYSRRDIRKRIGKIVQFRSAERAIVGPGTLRNRRRRARRRNR